MVIVDTSVIIGHLRGNPKATRFLERRAATGPIYAPALVLWELWLGATTPQRRSALQAALRQTIPDPLTPAMAQLAAELQQARRQQGRELPTFDLLIASHALFHGMPIATLDRDYSDIPGLVVEPLP